MSKNKKKENKTQKGKLKNKLCFLAAAVAAGTITTEDKKLYGGNVCTVRVNGILTGNPTTLGSAPGTDAIACGNGAVANGTNSITTGTGAFTGYSGGIAIGENSSAVRESDIAIGTGAGLYNQGLNAKRLPNGNLNTSATRGYNVIIGANAMVGDDSNNPVYTSQGIAIGGSGSTRTGTSKNNDSGGAWAKGDQSIAIGGDTIADGHSSIAIGGDDLRKAGDKTVTYTLASGTKTGSLRGALGDLAGVPAGDVQRYNATKAGAGAVALGVKSVSGDLSLSIGTMSTADKVNATAVGSAAVADLDNSVALGGGSTTANAAGTQVTSVTIDGVTYNNFSGGSGTKAGDVVSVGRSGTFNRQIKNVAAGNISATSTDAINGSQLYSVAKTLQDRFKYVSINSTETGNADNKGALATNSIAIGPNASTTATAVNSVVVGNGANTNSEGAVAIGQSAKVDNTTGRGGSTIGRYKNDDNSTYMGTSLTQNNIYADPSYVGTQGIAIGAHSYSDYQGMSMGVGARSKNLSLALGYFSNAEGTSSIATGVGAYAKGDNSISSGRQSSTISTGSVALGVAARGGSTANGGLGGSVALGAASDATHEQAIAIGGITNANTATLSSGRGNNTQATAARATAIGANAKAQSESSIALGTNSSVSAAGTNAVAIGKDSSAAIANGVALGSESKATTAAGVTGFDMADGRTNVYSGLSGTAKTANIAAISVGDGANKTRQITGVAAGKQDTDAVNVAQLKSTNLKIAGNTTSGGADVRLHDQTLTVKGDGTYLTSTAAGNTITMDLKQDVKDKINKTTTLASNTVSLGGDTGTTNTQALNKTGGIKFNVKGDGTYLTSNATGDDVKLDLTQTTKDKINNAATNKLDNLDSAGVQKIKDTAAWNVVANSGTAQKVQGGDTVKFLNGDNIEVTQAGKDFTFATKRDVNFDSVTVPTGAGNVVINNSGINAGGNKITNVADGALDSDAVNLGQLNNAINNATTTATSTEKVVASTAADNIATVAPSTGQNLGDKNATYEVTVSKTAVQNIAKDAAAWNVSTNGGVAEKVEGRDTVNFVNGDNIEVTNTGKNIKIATKKDVTFDTVTINNGGPKLSSTGVDAGNKKIINVADGTVGAGSKDAVNGGQLHDVKTSVTNNTTALNNLKNNTVSLGGDTGTTNTQALDKTGGIKFNVKGDGTYLTSNATGDDVKLDLTQTTKDKINNAATNKLDNLDSAGVQKIKDTAAWNVVANSGTAQKVQGGDTVKFLNGDNIEVTQAGKDFTFATKRDVNFDSVTVPTGAGNVVINNSGINAGGNKITNVADGALDSDAVNLGQLNAVKNSPMKFGGDSGTDVDRKLGEKLNVKGGATGNLTNNNIAVEADGNDTLNIKLAENINLGTNGSVKIGDSTLNNDGLTITGGPSITKTGGINAGGNKISNVAAGTANDDAVNVSQLNNAINNAGAAATIKYKANGGAPETVRLSDGLDFVNGSNTTATVGPNGVVKYDVNLGTLAVGADGKAGANGKTGADGTVGKNGIATTQDVAKAINSSAWKVTSTSSTGTVNTPSVEDVKNGDTVKFDAGDNIEITQNGKDFTFATKKDVTFDSVTINNGGPKLSATGIDAANKKITNVADGAVTATSKDAVNGSQLYGLSKNTVTVSGDSTSTTPQTLDQNGGIKLGIKSRDTNFLTSTANGTDVTLDLTQAAKDKINKVTTLSSNTVSLGGDTGATNTQALDKTGGIKFNVKGDGTYLTSNAANDDVTLDLTQAAKDKINNAATNKLDNLDPAGIQKIKDTAAWNVVANNGTAEKVEGGNTVKFKDGDNIEITQNGKDFTFATKRNVNFDSVTVPAGAGNVVINNSGINAGNNKITDVADGTIAPGSKEAVNGGQLHDVQNTINAGAFTVSASGGTKDRIAKDENIDFENTDGNISISYDATGNKFTYNLSPNLNLGPAGSLRIGNALLNNGGLTIVNGPSITSAGVDAGNKKVTNVADGTIGAGSKDAINGGQLHDVQTNLQTSINNNAQNIANNTNAINNLNTAVNNPITFTGDSGNNINRKLGETLNIKGGATGNLTSGNIGVEADSATNTLNVKLAENIDLGTNGSVKMGDTKINDNGLIINGGPSVTKTGIDAGNKKVTNVVNGDITSTSKDAINGSQLHGVADSIKNSIGGNTILNPDGTITTNNIGGTGHNNIHDAIASVNNAANQRTTVVAGDNIDVTVSTNATGGNEYTVATKRDIVVDSVSVANNGPSMNSNGINAGGKTISNLGAGVNPNDAVNVAQLDAVKNSPITFGADTGTDHAATLGSRVSITGDNKNITTSISGNNIQVAMSETPSFGTVNVNDANTGTITGASNVTLDNLDEDGTVGRVATEAQLAAVRNEVAGTKDIDNKLRGFKRGADAGTASAMAMAGIPQVINPGENAIGASISAYKQQTAVAVGYTRASKNGRAVLKISGSVNSNSELGFSLGFMKGWD